MPQPESATPKCNDATSTGPSRRGLLAGASGFLALAGLAAIVLGILAVVGTNPIVLTPVALIVMGATIVMTGSTLSGAVAGFMSSTTTTTSPKSSAV